MGKAERLSELQVIVHDMLAANSEAYLGANKDGCQLSKDTDANQLPTIGVTLATGRQFAIRIDHVAKRLLDQEIQNWSAEAIEPVIDRYFSGVKAALYGIERLSQEEAREYMLVRLEDPSYTPLAATAGAKHAWGGLVAYPVLKLPLGVYPIPEKQLDIWQLTVAKAIVQGVHNLSTAFDHLKPTSPGAPMIKLPLWTYRVPDEDAFGLESSFVLVHELVNRVPIDPKDMCVLLPAANMVVFARIPTSEEAYAHLVDYTTQFFHAASRLADSQTVPISPRVYRWHGVGTWDPAPLYETGWPELAELQPANDELDVPRRRRLALAAPPPATMEQSASPEPTPDVQPAAVADSAESASPEPTPDVQPAAVADPAESASPEPTPDVQLAAVPDPAESASPEPTPDLQPTVTVTRVRESVSEWGLLLTLCVLAGGALLTWALRSRRLP